MKYTLVLFAFFLLPTSWSQVFHLEDTAATITVSTTQSPAHWYLEIYNDCGSDTTLRWVTHFENIPAEWNIEFSVQNQDWPTINDGDSSDFIAFVAQDFPQKLIIGATTNQTPGHGSVFFDIFDPANRNFIQTIEYEFIVGNTGLSAINSLDFVQIEDGMLAITNGKLTEVIVYDLSGKIVLNETSSGSFDLINLPKNTTVIVHLTQGSNQVVFKLFQE
jgi:hypothetical protein